MKVLSLFDGMACGMLAMLGTEVEVDRYVAYEIDKYAVQTSSHNFPMIEHRGDVFAADFTEFQGFDWLIGGSPCTYWSIAQKNNRETEASGLGWELFSQYVRALHEAKPKYFIYENNKSMSAAIRESISETFGFEPICINSALVSAQNRQRLYWVGKRNEDGNYIGVDVECPSDQNILLQDVLESGCALKDKQGCIDANYFKGGNYSNLKKQSGQRMCVAESVNYSGSYSKVDVEQPTDRGILLKDILETGEDLLSQDKALCVTARIAGSTPNNTVYKHLGSMVAEPINETKNGKAGTVRASCYKDGIRNICGNKVDKRTGVAIPVPTSVRCRGRVDEEGNAFGKFEAREDGKNGALTANAVGANIAEPVTITKNIPKIVDKYGYLPEMFNAYNQAEITDKSPTLSTGSMATSSCAVNKLKPIRVGTYPTEDGRLLDSQGMRVYAVDGKSVTQSAQGGGSGAQTGLYAIPTDKQCDNVYEVKDGFITIKGKTYPIKLADGFYIIRKLTVRECMRLQTVPEWYEFPVSNSQAYKMLGNGWTVDVIVHLIQSMLQGE